VIERFAISTISLPSGGRIGLVRLPGHSADLEANVAAIVAWKSAIVVSLTERDEMERAGAADLSALLEARKIEWMHFPIVDYQTPCDAGSWSWPHFAARLHGVLDQGRGVLVHCMGGKGRSGMIALRLLVERDEDPDNALARIRAVRPGAIETEAQLRWAIAAQPRLQTKPTMDLAR
jgi:protein-tyrosine phosphatase